MQSGVAGTSRSPLPVVQGIPNGVHFWDHAAATFFVDKAARIGMQMGGITPPISQADVLPVCPEAAVTALEAILYRGRTPALPEWLSLAREARVTAPPHMLPALLDVMARFDVAWEAPDLRALWVSEQRAEWRRVFAKKRDDKRQMEEIRAPENSEEALPWAIGMLNDPNQPDIQAVWHALAYHTHPNAVHTWDALRDLPESVAASDWLRTREIWFFRLRMQAAFNPENNQHIP